MVELLFGDGTRLRAHDLAQRRVTCELRDGVGQRLRVFRFDVHSEAVGGHLRAELGARACVDHGIPAGQVVADFRDDALRRRFDERVHRDVRCAQVRRHQLVGRVAQKIHGGVQLHGQRFELLAIGTIAQHLHAHGG